MNEDNPPSLDTLQQELNRLRAALPHLREMGADVKPVEERIAWLEGWLVGYDDPDMPAARSGLEPMLGGSLTVNMPEPEPASARLQAALRDDLPIAPGESAPTYETNFRRIVEMAESVSMGLSLFNLLAGGVFELVLVVVVLLLRALLIGDMDPQIGDLGVFIRNGVVLWVVGGALGGVCIGAVGRWLDLEEDLIFEAGAAVFLGMALGVTGGALLVLGGDPLSYIQGAGWVGGMAGGCFGLAYLVYLANRETG